ncbi:hypothetical protein PG988_007195 [Apiospora saccharicola]
MENYPSPSYSYGDKVSDMAAEQTLFAYLDSQAMPPFGEAMAGTQGYLPDQNYTQLGYPHQQDCISPSEIEPAGGNSDASLNMGFGNFMYEEDYGEMPGIPSPAPTVTSSGRLEGCLVGGAMGQMSHTGVSKYG